MKLRWALREHLRTALFKVRKILFRASRYKQNKMNEIPQNIGILKTMAIQLIWGGVIVFTSRWMDSLLMCFLKVENGFDLSIITPVIIGGMGMAGVILGLYCSNVSSVFSAKYSNASRAIVNSFREDPIIKKCIHQIVRYIIICLLFLLHCIIKWDMYWISTLVFLFTSIRTVVTFSVAGNRSYILADSFAISDHHIKRIKTEIARLWKSKFISSDESFQNHYAKVCFKELRVLGEVAKYNESNPKSQNTTLTEYIRELLNLLSWYWDHKSKIPYSSYWYEKKPVYQQWHEASYFEVDRAIKTNSMIPAKEEKNLFWFENELFSTIHLCINKLVKDKDIGSLVRCYENIGQVAIKANRAHTEKFMYSQLVKLWDMIKTLAAKKDKNEEFDIHQLALVDSMVCSFGNIMAGVFQYYKDFDLANELGSILDISEYGSFDLSLHPYLNNEMVEQISQQIKAEKEIENSQITPRWFIEQEITYQMYIQAGEAITACRVISSKVYSIINELLATESIEMATVCVTQYIKIQQMSKSIIALMKSLLPAMERYYFEKTIIWKPVSITEFERDNDTRDIEIPDKMVKCCGTFAFKHWNNRQDTPDFLGFCYNSLCEMAIQTIESDSFQKFSAVYDALSRIVLVYQEYIRSSVVDRQEPQAQQWVLQSIVSPYIDYSCIIGAAIVWGELVENKSWRKNVEGATERFMQNSDDQRKDMIANIVNAISIQEHTLMGIGVGQMQRSKLERRLLHAMEQNAHFKLSYEMFGGKRLVTNSILLRAFCSYPLDVVGIHDLHSVYLVTCVNPYLKPESRYVSRSNWEVKMDEEN